MFFIDSIETEGIGNRSYLAGGARTAAVVDPPRGSSRRLRPGRRPGSRSSTSAEAAAG
ncbi:hypothetical protein AB4039_04675 [Streptomyces sp. M-16]|uniref:hypothetical protein n=1 Tax=Streptomyces sp. M-16 TaxID=3233040 RepID=UPI002255F3DA